MKRYSVPIFALLLTACALLRSQPKISLEQQAEWLQARAELAEARVALTAAEAKLSEIVRKIQTTCPLILKDGRPECQPKQDSKK